MRLGTLTVSGLSGYFKFRTSQQEDKDKEYNYNDVLPIINKVSKLKEIKETEEDQKEDNNELNINHSRKKSASDIVNNVLDAISNNLIIGEDSYNKEEQENNDYIEDNNEEEKLHFKSNTFRQEEDNENDIIFNHINNSNLNNSKDLNINEKSKKFSNNRIDKEKRHNRKKIILFEEFLSKENVNAKENVNE